MLDRRNYNGGMAGYDATGRMIRSWDKKSEEEKRKSEARHQATFERGLAFARGVFGPQSERMFRNYASGKVESAEIPLSGISKGYVFDEAMKQNRKRFEDSIVRGEVDGDKHDFKDQILKLKDGESVILNNRKTPGTGDIWDRDIGYVEGVFKDDPDQYGSTGSVKLRSSGLLKAKRKGNMVEVNGEVDHSVNDVYDFNEEDVALRPFRKMAEEGSAKPFKVFGRHRQKVRGFVEIENGDTKSSNFKWEDLD